MILAANFYCCGTFAITLIYKGLHFFDDFCIALCSLKSIHKYFKTNYICTNSLTKVLFNWEFNKFYIKNSIIICKNIYKSLCIREIIFFRFMEVREILDAILEYKLVSVRNLAHLLGASDLIFNSFNKLLISCFRDAICLSLCLISDKSFSSISEVLK